MIKLLYSPTYFFASYRKKEVQKSKGIKARTALIIKYNKRYLCASILFIIFFGTTWQWNVYPTGDYKYLYIFLIAFYIWLLPLSRCNEIFYVFIRDALDKVAHKKSHSNLSFSTRIRLSLNSYLELVINFGLIYYVLPCEWFNKQFTNIADALYFSGVTITTLGYGDFSPIGYIPKSLVIYEVFCGFSLLIVSFAIYAGRGLNENPNE